MGFQRPGGPLRYRCAPTKAVCRQHGGLEMSTHSSIQIDNFADKLASPPSIIPPV
jgi:hypothetical protein